MQVSKRLSNLFALVLVTLLALSGCQVFFVPEGTNVTIEEATPAAMATASMAETTAMTETMVMTESMGTTETTAMTESMAMTETMGMTESMDMTPTATMTESMTAPADLIPTAALRVTLAQLLGEHVFLAASATNAALHDRGDQFEAAAAALDNNSVDLAAAIGSVYGAAAGDAFLPLWRTHIGFFVDYTLAVAADDEAKRTEALTNLEQYALDFGAFLASANPNLTQEAVVGLLGPHVMTLTSVIDAQADDDQTTAFEALRQAYGHMDMIASALAGAIGQQFPEVFTGEVDSLAANLQVALNQLLAEHTYLAAMATDAALGGRTSEFEDAAAALDNNSIDLAAAIGSVYGAAAGDAFLPLWRTHIGFFVDYTLAVAAGDEAKRTEALANLDQYALDFGAFLASANPNLTQEAVVGLLGPHVMTLTSVIDAQAAGDQATAYQNLREAAAHMRMIADPLAGAIVAQFPEQFGESTTAEVTSAGDTEAMAAEPVMSAGMLRTVLRNLLGEHALLTSSATDAALRGRDDEFAAAAAAIDENSIAVAGAIGLVYGSEAGDAFLPLWRSHIGFIVDYVTGLATGDQAKQEQALAALDAYALDFGAFLQSANPNLPQDVVAELLRAHVATLIKVIDAQIAVTPQASGDQQKAYPATHEAYAHMDMTAAALAGGISAQFPALFPGDANGAAAGLRSALNALLAEHTYLVAKSAAAALDARNVEFEAAAGALDQNSQDIAAAIGSVYGKEAGDAFLPLWRKHIGFFIAYTLGLVEGDTKAQEKAVADLTAYTQDFGAFLNAANPNLPADVVAGLVGSHAQTTIAAIDAIAAEDYVGYYSNLHLAYEHMAMIANPLADAIAVQFPEQFGGEMGSAESMAEGMEMAAEAPAAVAPAATEGEDTVIVNIDTFSFQPAMLEIPVGTTVVWRNQDAIDHTVTSGTPDAKSDVFASELFNQGEEFSFTFTEVGDFAYFCQRHPSMLGMVVVVPAQ